MQEKDKAVQALLEIVASAASPDYRAFYTGVATHYKEKGFLAPKHKQPVIEALTFRIRNA